MLYCVSNEVKYSLTLLYSTNLQHFVMNSFKLCYRQNINEYFFLYLPEKYFLANVSRMRLSACSSFDDHQYIYRFSKQSLFKT